MEEKDEEEGEGRLARAISTQNLLACTNKLSDLVPLICWNSK